MPEAFDSNTSAKIIACEGTGYEIFLRHLAKLKLAGNQLSDVTFVHMKGGHLDIKDSEKLLPKAFQSIFPKDTVCVLRDPDFHRDLPTRRRDLGELGPPSTSPWPNKPWMTRSPLPRSCMVTPGSQLSSPFLVLCSFKICKTDGITNQEGVSFLFFHFTKASMILVCLL